MLKLCFNSLLIRQLKERIPDRLHSYRFIRVIKGHDVTILIGPEGDFSPAEIEWALQNGYQPISLGAARLRTETAAVVACCMAVQQE